MSITGFIIVLFVCFFMGAIVASLSDADISRLDSEIEKLRLDFEKLKPKKKAKKKAKTVAKKGSKK
jgi:hypothetical protein